MRVAIYVAAVLALAACAPESGRAILAGAAGTFFEAAPYLAGAAVLTALLGRRGTVLLPYVGCGCEGGPGARSLPATMAAALLFGPWIAAARMVAACAVAAIFRERTGHARHEEPLPAAFIALAPSAMLAGILACVLPTVHVAALAPVLQVFAGAVLGFAGAPCALGAVAVAGALRGASPLAADAFLCVAGIVDLRVFWNPHRHANAQDAIAYVLLALAASIASLRGGASLVHPHLAPVLAVVAVFAWIQAWRKRCERYPNARWIPALMLFAVVAATPSPPYVASATTLADAFPGERIDFTGMLVRSSRRAVIVRYAITCCRADAQPIAIELTRDPTIASGRWVRASGNLEAHGSELRLSARTLQLVTPPSDPFVYR